MARNKPRWNTKLSRYSFINHYLVGKPSAFFRYTNEVGNDVLLDELIECNRAMPLSFDVKINLYPSDEGNDHIDFFLQAHVNSVAGNFSEPLDDFDFR